MDNSRWPTLLLLLVAAVTSGVLVLRGAEEDPGQGPELGIGYYMQQAQFTRTGENGRILYRLQTDKATQIATNGIIKLDAVLFSYNPLTEVPWDLRADTGYILSDRNIIRLTGDVIAITREESRAPISIDTDYLELNTDTYIANTDRDVVIDYTNNTIFATGLRAYLKEERLQLISNVNGYFIP